MTIFYSQNRSQELTNLFRKAYGNIPPFEISWEECFDTEELTLFFETSLPSPDSYKKNWLKNNLSKRQFIPYILYSAVDKNLEGATKVDTILLNPKNGFVVIIESKVLSDISYDTTYDTMRN